MQTVIGDLRYALRGVSRAPGFALAVVLTLGLGIGVASAVYSIGNGLLWRPLPVPDPGRLAVLYAERTDGGGYEDLSWADYRDLRSATRDVFSGLIAYYPTPLALSRGAAGAERVWGERVSANYFSVLGSTPRLGRGFLSGEDSAGSAPVAVVSDAFWRARLAADPAALGSTIRLNGHAFTVVGVAPAGFQSPYYVSFTPEVWVTAAAFPLLQPGAGSPEVRGEASFRMLGRLRPGVTFAQAGQAVAGAVRRLAETYPLTNAGVSGVVFPEREARPEPGIARDFRLALVLLLVLAGMVVAVACANVASLLLARALARRREIAVRLALGAGRLRLVRGLMAESLMLGGAGGGLGLLLAVWITSGFTRLLRFPTDVPFVLHVAVDRRVAVFAALITGATTILFGLAPALQASSPALVGALKDATGGWGVHRSRLRNLLVVGQLAVSCALLAGTGLVFRTLETMRRVPLGFDPHQTLLVSLAPGMAGYDSARTRVFYREVAAAVGALPGVRGAALAQYLPMEFASNGGTVLAEGRAARPGETGEAAGWSAVDQGYFATIGTPIVAGRGFGPGDSAGAPPVAVVSRTMAARLWPGEAALGRRFRRDGRGPALTVVGVAADARYRSVGEGPTSYFYLPLSQADQPAATLVVRTRGDPLAALPAVRRSVAALDPELPLSDIKTFDRLIAGRALLFPRIAASVTAGMGALALVLALVGLYGVVAYAVTRRNRELGIRMALGATAGGVVRQLLGEGLRLALLGGGIGILAAVALGRLAGALLFGVSPLDPLVLGATVALLGAATVLASWLPARRAARTDPVAALRSD